LAASTSPISRERPYSMILDVLLLENAQPRPRRLISGVGYACSMDMPVIWICLLYGYACYMDIGIFRGCITRTCFSSRSHTTSLCAARSTSTASRDFAGRAAAAGKHVKARYCGGFEQSKRANSLEWLARVRSCRSSPPISPYLV
jgi:hypothetical protein